MLGADGQQQWAIATTGKTRAYFRAIAGSNDGPAVAGSYVGTMSTGGEPVERSRTTAFVFRMR